ncbi:molybdopterin-dependent oxidoreductase [Bacillus atrophaeus]|uniref:molybdopterin-dependent oxidoreductase n=1 Tax=Bacillus atrophaeus TaxID=1452 RepID=UPI0022806B65|nr:molybdopterin-dependent oxidoreductase [Bacillus atrophaeus]MCY8908824.1 molybdopterin-dependent oxidoreductase [Bacillus atrophaeus]MEC0836527.1 molybdopterin-dependent oxidoreductase [Bacillus atrophaeus]MEC0844838.1 molybdopterin-dependent oxidoreductase [Bacillus atrophaeus]MEC0848820.1 molybdopterin-dependent oxidoreductase [Bacillus atrophaeus]MEC0863646.1 molybdopterin-dependent oxidoreductase [Bacillus atrophaeus]
MSKVHQSACPLNCWDSCGFLVTVENEKVKKVDGDPHHPITEGKICGRGRMLETKTNAPERLRYPMKKQNGEFVRISWYQALDEIADRMQKIKETAGTTAVLHSHDYANNGLLKALDQRFFNGYGGVTEIVGSICWGSGIEAQSWDFGRSYGHGPLDIYNSKHVIVWGRNVSRTNMHLYHHLQQVKKQGATLTVIDPIFNPTAKLADRYISVKPGMDGWLAAGVLKILIQSGKTNEDFIRNHSFGFDEVASLLASVSLEEIIVKTETSMEELQYLADLYADGPTGTFMGLGMQRYKNGGGTIRWIDALVAASGNVGIKGGGANFGNVQIGESFAKPKLTLPELKTQSRTFSMMTQAEEILTAADPAIEMIIVTCGNPLTQVPNTNKVKEAFEKVPMTVAIDSILTDTAKLCDYVLPTATVFEEEDIYYSSMYHHFVQYGKKLVEPQGEAKSDSWIWGELAERLGFGELFEYSTEEFLQMGLSSLEKEGVTLERLKEKGHLPLPVKEVPWDDYKFLTPSGKFEFVSSAAEKKGYSGLPQLDVPEESAFHDSRLAEKYPYTLLSIHPQRSNHSQHVPFIEKMQHIQVDISPDIADEQAVQDGDVVVIFNERGRLEGKAKIMKQAHPKTINIDEGMWSAFGGSVNTLTKDTNSDNGMGSTLFDCLVGMKKA